MPRTGVMLLHLYLLPVLTSTPVSAQATTVRLTRGSASEGYLEVYHDGRWGTVCDDAWGSSNVQVACRQLGLDAGSGTASYTCCRSSYGLSVWLDQLSCTGREERIEDCSHNPWGHHDCSSENVYLTCNPSRCQLERAQGTTCQNGATFLPRGTDSCCQCTPYTTGPHCAQGIDECLDNNGGCSHKCSDLLIGYNCSCPDPELELGADQHTCYSPHAGVTCTSDGMSINLEKAGLPGFRAEYLVVDGVGPGCSARDTGSSIVLNLPLNDCGTTRRLEGDEWVYENHITSSNVTLSGVVSPSRKLNVTVRCRYPRYQHIHQTYSVHTEQLSFVEDVHGQFPVQLDIEQGGNVYHPGDPALVVDPGVPLTLRFSLQNSHRDLEVFAHNCSATPTADTSDPSTLYHIIKDGCIMDTTLQDYKNGSDEQLTLQAFKFVGTSGTVFLHCDVMICNASDQASRCQQGCLTPAEGTSRHSNLDPHSYTSLAQRRLSYGPWRVVRQIFEEEEKEERNQGESEVQAGEDRSEIEDLQS